MTKNYFISMQKGFLALMSAALLFSCSQIEPFEMEGDDVLFSSAIASLKNCEDHCISDDNPDSYQKIDGMNSISWGGQSNEQHTKTINYVAYNTETQFIIEVSFSRLSPGGVRSTDVKTTFEGNEEIMNITSGSKKTFYFPLPQGWTACQNVNFEIFENSDEKEISISESYKLYGICADCKNELKVNFQCGDVKTATFTFFAEEAGPIVIQGGLTNGTTINNATSNVLVRNTTHSGVVNSNANVTRWEGNVEACQEVTISIEFTGGTGIGDWSAKRDEVVLGSTEEKEC